MDHFIHDENLKLWRRKLSETDDPGQRSVLIGLIDRETDRFSRPGGSDEHVDSPVEVLPGASRRR